MFIGYTSDERYVALPGVLLEFRAGEQSFEVRSRASGAVYADVPPGEYDVVLYREGFGSKRVRMTVAANGPPYHFRLLSDCLLGYAWPKWVRAGESSEFRVHAIEPYKLELWRYGWEKQFVRSLGWYDEHGPRATMQITPDGDYSQSGVRFNEQGYTSPHHKQWVVAPDKSGLYYFHASTATGSHFSFPWIVAPREPAARIAVLASNLTWNAYNSFGGRSNYIHPDQLPPSPTVNSRQELRRYTDVEHINYDREDYAPLSFDRPEPINVIGPDERITDPIEGRAACHVAPAEWRLLGWLERERFDYDLYAETQLHAGQLNLADYQLLILSAHPEYWSRSMYDQVKAWVFDAGGRLVYLGGNGLNCEVELPDERTMMVRNGDARKLRAERGRYDSRFAMRHESEACLLGVVYSDVGIMTAAPYRVVDGTHWAFEGTGLKKGDVFGRECLHMRCPGGASGHETDKISPRSPSNTRLLAKGMNPDGGGAEMVHYETPSGGQVFSAGSICYPSSLPVDEAISRITANVVRRFLD